MKHAIRTHVRDFAAILGLLVFAGAICLYILTQQGVRIPLVEEGPKRIKVELENAQAVAPGQGQSARVAGVEVGEIGDVTLEDGAAVVDVQVDAQYENLIRRDATALLRPKTPIKDMFLEIDPGNGPVLPDGGTIGSSNTAPDVDPDEIFAALDADTRPYLKTLISGAGKGLRGHGEDLRATLRRLEPLHRDLARVTRATASRRRALKRLVHNYGLLVAELGRRPSDLRRLVSSSRSVFAALAGEDQNISTAVARLPGALRESARTLREVEGFASELRPTLESLRAPIRKLDASNRAVRPFLRDTTPVLRTEIRPFVRAARPFTRDLSAAASDAARAAPDLNKSLGELNRFVNIGAFNPDGAEGLAGMSIPEQRAREEGYLYWLAWTAQNGVSLFNTADAQGPWRRLTICGVSPAVITGLLSIVLSRVGTEDPPLASALTGGPGGTIQPGSPVAALQESQFGSCSYDQLESLPAPPTPPLAP
jgi:phospholipid/cholesterol/gamma-HCH transport system substrate-binding protein